MEVLKEIKKHIYKTLKDKPLKELDKNEFDILVYLLIVDKLDKETCDELVLKLDYFKDKKIKKLIKILHPDRSFGGSFDGYFGGDNSHIYETNNKYLEFQVLLKEKPTPEMYSKFLKEHFEYLAKNIQKGKTNLETNIKTTLHTYLDMDISKFLDLFSKTSKKKNTKNKKLDFESLMSETIVKNEAMLKLDELGLKMLELYPIADESNLNKFKISMMILNCYKAIINHKTCDIAKLKEDLTKFSITKFRERKLPENLQNLENFHYECNDEIPCMVKKLLEKEIYASNFIRDKDNFEDNMNKFIKNCEDVYHSLTGGSHEKFLIGFLYSKFTGENAEIFDEYLKLMNIKDEEIIKDGIIELEAFMRFSESIHNYQIVIMQ